MSRWMRWATLVCAGVLASAVQARELRIGVGNIPLFAPVIVANAEGYFKQQGLSEVKVINCILGKLCLQKMLAGELELATVAATPLAIASFTQRDFDILATITTTGADNKLFARTDRGIKTPADLRGKKIGIVRGTSSQFFLESVLLFYGIPLNHVTLVNLNPLDMAGPLVRGEVDAVGAFEPFGYQVKQQMGPSVVRLNPPNVVKIAVHLVVGRGARSPSNDDLIRILKALEQAAAFTKKNPTQAISDVATYLKVPRPQIEAVWDDYEYGLSLDQTIVTNLESQALWVKSNTPTLAKTRMPDYLDMIRPGPLLAVDPKSVTLVK